jgi:hypothetical protein
MRPLEKGKRSIEDEERGCCKSRENAPLDGQRPHEHIPKPKRPEPEQINPVREKSAASEEDDGDDHKQKEELSITAPRWLHNLGPLD